MKRKNFKRKIVSYLALWSVFIGSLLLYSPGNIAYATSGDPVTTVEAGTDTTPLTTDPGTATAATGSDTEITQQTTTPDSGTATTQQPATSTTTTTTDSGASATTPTQQTANLAATLSQPAALAVVNRPYMVAMNLVGDINDQNSYLSAEDMTQVPLNNLIRVVVRNAGTITKSQHLLEVTSAKGDKITGTENLVSTTALANGLNEYVYTFTPEPAGQLLPSTTYYVYLNPGFTNDDGNRIIPRFLKFTTISTNTQYQFVTNEFRKPDVIHGNFSNVTASCDYCHSSHNGSDEFLKGGKFGSAADNMCMACHDGTNGSPMPDKYNTTNKHYGSDSTSCTSCHDPHSDWTKDNPNHFNKNGTTTTYSYKKAGSATGSANDYSLCLSCHNGSKASNIQQYYNNTTYTSQSGHNITATDDSGSSLNGQIPCAECHETHGSTNMKMLRDQLGNVQITDDTKKFTTIGTTWDAANERKFCLSCHNGSTVLYGKTGSLNLTDANSQPITGHQEGDLQTCSSCHGGTSKSFIEAAHSPSK